MIALAALAVAVDRGIRSGAPGRPEPAASPTVPVDAAPARVQTPPSPIAVVQRGPGTFSFATGPGRVIGRAGAVRRYRVAVEDGIGVPAAEFATAVQAILADPRSWIAGRSVRLQQVAPTAPAEFTIYLATPATSERICREQWLETHQYTNCRLSTGKVVINSARWLTAVPGYGAPLPVYQAYAINHEVGHQLGQGHELCPGPGEVAPVMAQQTLGLRGCVANPWPYPDGVRYRGPPAPD